MKFDYVSDLHADSWVIFEPAQATRARRTKFKNALRKWISSLLPEKPSRILVIAGDISTDNAYTVDVLKELQKHYENIVFVVGNIDMHLRRAGSHLTCQDRVDALKACLRDLPGVYLLDGDTVEIGDITFGGTCGWYDNAFTGMTDEMHRSLWRMHYDYEGTLGTLDTDEFAKKQKEVVAKLAAVSDVLVTHVTPLLSVSRSEGKYHTFDATSLSLKSTVWVCGHVHAFSETEVELGGGGTVAILRNPIGNPKEQGTHDPCSAVIRTFNK